MRSIGLLAVVTGTLVLVSSCSDGAGTPPPDNTAPVALFDLPSCLTGGSCTFVSKSTDDVAVTSWSWDFDGDGHEDANTATASFQFPEAKDYNVSLTVKDAEGLSNTKTQTITVTSGNPAPTASFTYTCTAVDCSFTSTSSDAAPGSIATYAWDFGDGATSDQANPTHGYSVTAASDFTVTLTVTDNEGATAVATQTIHVVPPVNTPPTAAFTYNCNATACSFTSTSTDAAPGTIATYAWTFGDDGKSALPNPVHNYAVTDPSGKDFVVTLTVTDDTGLTGDATQTIHVAPPAPTAEGCVTSGTKVDCALNITSLSFIKLKITGLSCDLSGTRVVSPATQSGDQMFLNICFTHFVGDSTRIFGGVHDTSIPFDPGSQAIIRFVQGTAGSHDPTPGAPTARLEGTFPNWTISFEDGAHPGDAGEPDFADIVLSVEAIPGHH
jgi:PKD repeat protein